MSLRFGVATKGSVLLLCLTSSGPTTAEPLPSVSSDAAGVEPPPSAPVASSPLTPRLIARKRRLETAALAWVGTPYQFGGDSREGIDCSAYVRAVYRGAFGVILPRSTKGQVEMGLPISILSPATLVPGDLLFYRDQKGKTTHVVLYIGDGVVSHAIKGRGVVIEGLAALKTKRIERRRILRAPGLNDRIRSH